MLFLCVLYRYGDGWDQKSWIEIVGSYDNIVFKGYLRSQTEEVYSLSCSFYLSFIMK